MSHGCLGRIGWQLAAMIALGSKGFPPKFAIGRNGEAIDNEKH